MSTSSNPAWIKKNSQGLTLLLWVQPGASKTEITGTYGDPPRLKLKVKSPPVDGKANEAVIDFLRKTLDIPKSSISIIRGELSRQKDLLLSGITLEDAVKLLAKDKILL